MTIMEFTRVSEQLATAPQVRPEDLREIAAAGFVGIINNRPDAEAPDQPTALDLEAEAKKVGLDYWHVPVVPGAMTDTEVRAFAAALEKASGPVLAFCRTGNRSAALWNASQTLA
jgi:sulfide:quinone oxidoreductase